MYVRTCVCVCCVCCNQHTADDATLTVLKGTHNTGTQHTSRHTVQGSQPCWGMGGMGVGMGVEMGVGMGVGSSASRGKRTALGTILAGSTEGTANRLAPNRMEGAMKE